MMEFVALQSIAPLPLDEIRAHLDALPTVQRDRWNETMYIVADTDALLRDVLEEREQDQSGFPRIVVLVELSAHRILIAVSSREVETARAFARWARSRFDVAVLGSGMKDITAETDADFTNVFGPVKKRKLEGVGFFRELKHGRADGPSLAEARREKGRPGEGRIAKYLRAAPILLHAMGPVSDVFEPKGHYICAPNIHTDGAYAWPEDLAYYVERYHVALPEPFLAHLAAAKWTAPADVALSTVEL